MKEISETIKRISAEDLKDLAVRLELKTKSKKDLMGTLLTVTGMDAILRNLDTNSLRVLKLVYAFPEGITFIQIHKELKIEIQSIEKIIGNLGRNLLIYVIKNRQMLNIKQDKAYGISEVAELLNLTDPRALMDRLHKNFLNLEMQKQVHDPHKTVRDRNIRELFEFMAESGCIITLDAAREKLPTRSVDRILSSLLHQNLIYVYHAYQPEFNTYLVLNEKISPYIAGIPDAMSVPKHVRVRNRYFLLNNLLNAFDVISTFGLFLTKQMEFRKIDIRRIADSMLPIRDIAGNELTSENLAQLSIFILNRLACLKLNKDIAGISLAELKDDLEQPLLLLNRVLKCTENPSTYDPSFAPPFDLPTYDFSKSIIKLLHKMNSVTYRYMMITMLTKSISERDERSYAGSIMYINDEMERIWTAINFLCIAGIIDLTADTITLSDIGRQLANHILKTHSAEYAEPIRKSIYINPDFTLVIPTQEINSDILYHLMSHTDIVKNDLILNAVITRSSVVRAQKRGMSLAVFLESLESNSKNDLPQNLDFLLREWSNQTIMVKISHVILMKTSHPEFIDELLLGLAKAGIVERISGTHAIVKKDYIDEIIKLARKKDTVISLFNEMEDEN
jgi:hypothetical protein